MTDYICASVKALETVKLECDPKLIRAIWKAENKADLFNVYPMVEQLEKSVRGYYGHNLSWLKKECINVAGGFHGVEYLGRHARTGQQVEYCNAGDTYAGTIIFIGSRLIVSTWGDLVERRQVKTDD